MAYTKTQWNPGGPPAVNAENLNKIEQGIYDAHVTADAAVKKSGDTMTGALQFNDANTKMLEGNGNAVRIQTDSGYVEVGPQNTTYAHIYTDRGSFYLNKDVLVNGNTVWHAGNDGAGSGLDADKVKGKNITVSSTAPSNPQVNDIWIQI